jgi:hypothetical protein
MARGSKKLKTVALRMKVSPNLYEYLGFLVRETVLGASENDVATFLLTERLRQLKDAGYPSGSAHNSQQVTEQK